jgi:uncharacterized protein (UPF0264 family)
LPGKQSAPILLASVGGPDEAEVALRAGAGILDAKDPSAGSLGACAPQVLRAIVARRGLSGVPVSAALGDAADQPGTFALAASGAAACGADYLKIGLRFGADDDRAVAFLSAVVHAARAVAPAIRVVAAAYAEAASIGTVPPARLPAIAARSSASGCLIDTALKDGRSLFDHLGAGALARFVAQCRERGLQCGLAGSLSLAHLSRIHEIGPDVIGVRGAICAGGRNGILDPVRLREFADALNRRAADASRPA